MEEACLWRGVQNSPVYFLTGISPISMWSDTIPDCPWLGMVPNKSKRYGSEDTGKKGHTLLREGWRNKGIRRSAAVFDADSLNGLPGSEGTASPPLPGNGQEKSDADYEVCAPTVSKATGYRTMPPIPSRAPLSRGRAMNASSGQGNGGKIPDSWAGVNPNLG
jgi:hypothetical protein